MRFFCLFTLLAVSASASAQQVSHPGRPAAPIRNADPGMLAAEEFAAIEMTDYEVWVARDTSKFATYEVYLKTSDGWDVIGKSAGGMQFEPRQSFGTREEAELFAELELATNPDVTDYLVVSIVPDMEWLYLDTYDSRAEAEAYLDELMAVFGEEYVGDIRAVTVLPKALR